MRNKNSVNIKCMLNIKQINCNKWFKNAQNLNIIHFLYKKSLLL